MKLDVILPAGGRISGPLAEEAGTDVKALLRIGRKTILERTLETVCATGRASRVVVVGPDEVAPYADGLADVVLPETGSGAENILRALWWLSAAQGEEHALIITTDLPFLTPDALNAFLDACPPHLDLCVPVIAREAFETRFTRAAARYARLRDGEWLIGCAVRVRPATVVAQRSLANRVFAERRSRIGMARMLGLPFLVRFLTGRLTVAQVQSKALEILGCTGSAIRVCPPELAFDIDYPEDYQQAVALWRSSNRCTAAETRAAAVSGLDLGAELIPAALAARYVTASVFSYTDEGIGPAQEPGRQNLHIP
jgi:GTP:adenosylcobinamide-phosphate guanylyltransferase